MVGVKVGKLVLHTQLLSKPNIIVSASDPAISSNIESSKTFNILSSLLGSELESIEKPVEII